MNVRKHHNEKRAAGSHTTVTEIADPVIRAIKKICPDITVQNGHISVNAGARARSVKITEQKGYTLVVVVSKETKQEFRLYGKIDVDSLISRLSSDNKVRSYIINKSKHSEVQIAA